MDLLSLIVVVLVLGLVWWAISQFGFMPPWGMTALKVAFVITIVFALLSFLGIAPNMNILHYKPHIG